MTPKTSRSFAIRQGLGLAAVVVLACPSWAASGLTLGFSVPSEVTATRQEARASYLMPLGAFREGTIPATLTEGRLDQQVWRLQSHGQSTFDLMQDLRAQVVAAGFELLFECETETCGGFDFRYGTEVVAEPDMHVDLGDFRYLAAQRGSGDAAEYLSLFVSRSLQDSYVQMTRVGALPAPAAELTASTKTPQAEALAGPASAALTTAAGADLAAALDSGGPLVLEDLVFSSGSSGLQAGDYASLAALADWLKAHPQSRVLLVGHTDSSGGQAANQAISERRAESVRQVLLTQFDIPAAQVAAAGAGMLAPRASNLDETGRMKNRRVEVFTTSTR